MSSPEELLQQVRDATLPAQEFLNQCIASGANIATYGHLIAQAFAIEKDRDKEKAEAEKAEAVAEAVKTKPKAKTPKKEKDVYAQYQDNTKKFVEFLQTEKEKIYIKQQTFERNLSQEAITAMKDNFKKEVYYRMFRCIWKTVQERADYLSSGELLEEDKPKKLPADFNVWLFPHTIKQVTTIFDSEPNFLPFTLEDLGYTQREIVSEMKRCGLTFENTGDETLHYEEFSHYFSKFYQYKNQAFIKLHDSEKVKPIRYGEMGQHGYVYPMKNVYVFNGEKDTQFGFTDMFTVGSEQSGSGSSKIVEIPKGLENIRLRVRRPTIRSPSKGSKGSNVSVKSVDYSEGAIVKCLETYSLVHTKNGAEETYQLNKDEYYCIVCLQGCNGDKRYCKFPTTGFKTGETATDATKIRDFDAGMLDPYSDFGDQYTDTRYPGIYPISDKQKLTNSESTLNKGDADPEGTVKRVMSSKWYCWKKTDLCNVLSKSDKCVDNVTDPDNPLNVTVSGIITKDALTSKLSILFGGKKKKSLPKIKVVLKSPLCKVGELRAKTFNNLEPKLRMYESPAGKAVGSKRERDTTEEEGPFVADETKRLEASASSSLSSSSSASSSSSSSASSSSSLSSSFLSSSSSSSSSSSLPNSSSSSKKKQKKAKKSVALTSYDGHQRETVYVTETAEHPYYRDHMDKNVYASEGLESKKFMGKVITFGDLDDIAYPDPYKKYGQFLGMEVTNKKCEEVGQMFVLEDKDHIYNGIAEHQEEEEKKDPNYESSEYDDEDNELEEKGDVSDIMSEAPSETNDMEIAD
jgi:hypothetical protein